MKLIKLTQGFSAQVDDWNYDWLNQWKWCVLKFKTVCYAARVVLTPIGPKKYKRECILMHRLIMNTPKDLRVDHRDFDGLNNQEYNMRNCDRKQNARNRKAHGISGYLGVSYSYSKTSNYIQITAKIGLAGERIYLGSFKTEEEAAHAYDEAAKIYFGEFANLNFK